MKKPSEKTLKKHIANIKEIAAKSGLDVSGELSGIEEKFRTIGETEAVWKKVELARHPARPTTLDYIERIFSGFVEFHGDRAAGDDSAIVGGVAFLDDEGGTNSAPLHLPVTVVGHQKGRNLKDNIYRNHGMANPEGFRKALRLARQAEKFHRPIVTFIDTGGAYPGIGAEERGISEAIARNLRDFSQLRVPIICVIIGEGGSGGALGICIGDKLYMLENAIYSVISPEGGASIMLRDPNRAKDAAALLKITSADLRRFRLVTDVISEPPGGAHTDPDSVAAYIKRILVRDLRNLCKRNPAVLVRYRTRKIQNIGHWNELGNGY